MMKIYIDGSHGTTGLLLQQRLEEFSNLECLALPETLRKDEAARRDAMNAADVVFLCLPDVAATEAVQLVTNPHTVIIDTSTAHRTAPGWVYGFPQLSPEQPTLIRQAKRIANPGCHATGAIALLAPLVAADLLPPDSPLAITSVTGYTGGGKQMIAEYESAERMSEFDAPRAYSLTARHKHIPEIMRYAGLTREPAFMPIVADYPQGMQVLIPVHGADAQRRAAFYDALRAHYAGCTRIDVFAAADPPPSAFSASNVNAGTDNLTLCVAGHGDIAVLTAQFDNLGKGAAGAAVENLRIILGQERH